MKIDWSLFEGELPSPQQNERKPLTPGFHFGVVEAVKFQPGWRVDDRNPSGDCLSIWIDCEEDGQKKRVFYTVACNWTRKLMEIARCAGVTGPQRGEEDWDESELVGQTLYVETSTYIVQSGKNVGEERPKVVQFVDASKQPKATETTTQRRARHDPDEITNAPRRTMTQKTHAKFKEANGADDIPF